MWIHKIMWSKGDVTYDAQTRQDNNPTSLVAIGTMIVDI